LVSCFWGNNGDGDGDDDDDDYGDNGENEFFFERVSKLSHILWLL
jgi:hypothetical protein